MTELTRLRDLTLKWSSDRGIITNGKTITQALKLSSEMGELAGNVLRHKDFRDDIGDCLVVLTNMYALEGSDILNSWEDLVVPFFNYPLEFIAALAEAKGNLDDNLAKQKPILENMGTIIGILKGISYYHELTIIECWEKAYNDIKDRKGFLNEHGNFIKESDPSYELLYKKFLSSKASLFDTEADNA
jgi:hypothetical protein